MTFRLTSLAVLLAGASILACSSDGDSPSGPCEHRHDYYYSHSSPSACYPKPLAGGPIEVDNQRTEPEYLASGCTGTITYSADNCVETRESTCQGADGPTTAREVIHWSADGDHGTFVLEGATCLYQGTYDRFGTSEACASLAEMIAERAAADMELRAMGRESDPCVDPVAVTKTTDYGPACTVLDECLCAAGQKEHC